jgi:hypothetical protein
MKTFYSQLKLTWCDDCCRIGRYFCFWALGVSLVCALAKTFGVGAYLWFLGAAYLYTTRKERGVVYARTIQYNGYRFKVWQGCSGPWFWRSVGWPFLDQGSCGTEFEAQKEAETYIDSWLLTRISQMNFQVSAGQI